VILENNKTVSLSHKDIIEKYEKICQDINKNYFNINKNAEFNKIVVSPLRETLIKFKEFYLIDIQKVSQKTLS
jgi:hypothetical protein